MNAFDWKNNGMQACVNIGNRKNMHSTMRKRWENSQ